MRTTYFLSNIFSGFINWYNRWSPNQRWLVNLVLLIFAVVIIVGIVRTVVTIVAPRKTEKASIEKKYVEVNTQYQNGMVVGESRTPYLVFRFVGGKKIKFRVSWKNYKRFSEGDYGVLFYKGYHFSDFHVL